MNSYIVPGYLGNSAVRDFLKERLRPQDASAIIPRLFAALRASEVASYRYIHCVDGGVFILVQATACRKVDACPALKAWLDPYADTDVPIIEPGPTRRLNWALRRLARRPSYDLLRDNYAWNRLALGVGCEEVCMELGPHFGSRLPSAADSRKPRGGRGILPLDSRRMRPRRLANRGRRLARPPTARVMRSNHRRRLQNYYCDRRLFVYRSDDRRRFGGLSANQLVQVLPRLLGRRKHLGYDGRGFVLDARGRQRWMRRRQTK